MKITPSALTEYFRKGGQYVNKNKLVIAMTGDVFYLTAKLYTDAENDHLYELYDEVFSVEEFIEAYNIGSIKDLELLTVANIWIRYFSEKAEVIFTDGDDNAIHFRKFRSRTMVFSLDLNYYSEANKVLNMTDHFKDYIQTSWAKLESLSYKN